MRHKTFFLVFTAVFLTFTVNAATPGHPLSDIGPMDVPLNLDGNPITDSQGSLLLDDDVTVSGDLSTNSNLDMSGNSIINFFSSPCPAGMAVSDISDDGTINCMSPSSSASNFFVNRTGDDMTGNLNMSGNLVRQVGAPVSSSDAVRKGYTDNTFLFTSGDKMDGYLDMVGNEIRNVGTITDGSGNEVYERTSVHSNLASGWYTIAENGGDRASAKFIVKDQEGGEHSTTHFYASDHYGEGDSINVLSTSDYGSGCVRELRLKDGGTYEGALLQAYLDQDSCSGVQAFMMENVQNQGWELRDWVSGDTITGLTESVRWNLDAGVENSAKFSNGLETKGEINTNGNNLVLSNSPSSTAEVKGSKMLYAGDETEVSVDSSTYTEIKTLTLVFDSQYGINPDYINIIANIENADLRVSITGQGETGTQVFSGTGLKRGSLNTVGWSDGVYDVSISIRNNGGSALNDIIEFYYVR